MDSLFDGAPLIDQVRSGQETVERGRTGDTLVDEGVVLRVAERPSIPLAGGTRWERLTPLSETRAEFIEVIYPPAPSDGTQRQVDYIQHSSREYGLILSGTLTVQVGFNTTQLHAGDSIAFDSVMPHRFWNETSTEVRAVWFIADSPHAGSDTQSAHVRLHGAEGP